MQARQLKSWSERQQVVAIILMGGALIWALWFFLLSPLGRERKRLEDDIGRLRSQLASKNYLLGEALLQQELRTAEEAQRVLDLEWRDTMERVEAFADETDDAGEGDVGHIEYKVALFDVRNRLLKKSRELKISLPHDLGLDEAVRSDEDARKLMFQLRTVEKLVDDILDLKIYQLKEIEPLPPRLHRVGEDEEPFIEEYPVRVRFYGKIDNLLAMCRAVKEPGQVFALGRFRVESDPRQRPELLEVTARFSALVFREAARDMESSVAERPVTRAPLGI